ncbi:MAG: alpha/beta hydrolase [Erysipelothrix sp.]|nr:alpha/beta hydrolase [Erysipelothrix sp.]
MPRKYTKKLIVAMNERQFVRVIDGEEVLVKPLPDSDTIGAMDRRLYKMSRLTPILVKFIPKKTIKTAESHQILEGVRILFNKVNSTPIVDEKVETEVFEVQVKDGTMITVTKFESEHTLENAPVLYYIHGGGFFAGSTDVVADALKLIVVNTGIIIYSVDYRLAPEYPYPIGHQDVYTGLQWVHEHTKQHGGDPANIFVAGDSAGGNLAAYCSNRNINEGTNLIKGQLLLYPTVNIGGVSDTYVDFSWDKIAVYKKHKKVIAPGLKMFAGAIERLGDILDVSDEEAMTQYITPYLEVSPQSPVSFITVGEHDFLTVETIAYARKLKKAGVHTETILYNGVGHAYLDQIGHLPQAEDCAIEMGKFILKHSGR